MRRFIPVLLFIFAFTSLSASAQLFEDFESDSKVGYAGGSITLASGNWYLEDALIRSDGSGDLKNGTQSVRIRDGFLRMDFNKNNGADEIIFLAGNSDFSGDGEGVIQVYYSIDSGSNWITLGDEIDLSNSLEEYSIDVQKSENIRFRINKVSGGRVNIDDLRITNFIVAQDTATISVIAGGASVETGSVLSFEQTLVGTSRAKTIEITNIGNTTLDISEVAVSGTDFSISALTDSSLAFNESGEFTLTYTPTAGGMSQGSLSITSNAGNASDFSVTLSGEAFEDGDIIPISEARGLPLGTRVSVTGRVTVANELGGPLYMQDATAGIAVFWEPLHTTAVIGDSVTVTGPLTVFNPLDGNDSDFLLQISDTDTDNNILFEVIETESRIVPPAPVNVTQLNSGNYEGQLVQVSNATIDHTGAFQANTNYTLSDVTGDAELRIDNNTNLVGVDAPATETNVVGVVGKFAGIYQLLPRFAEDIGAEPITFPGDTVSKDFTLDVVTWNIEWFGDASNGPEDDNLQFENVKTLITTLDADIYALQEISNPTLFADLDEDLTEYKGIIANWSQSQKTAYLYKDETIQLRSSGLITSGMVQSDWANGRYPLFLQVDATINEEVRELWFFNIHAKAFAEQSDYEQRVNASAQLKSYLDTNRDQDHVFILGDFNDEILMSTAGGDSPYKNFDDDVEYTIVTKSLEEEGYTSYSSNSMIDHIMFTSELTDEYFAGTERVENPFYIGSFLSETSDHFPVWTRFKWGTPVSTEESVDLVTSIRLDQNYPNPFNPSTVINYQLPEATQVDLEVFNMMGRKVATIVSGRQSAGEQSVTFSGTGLASGIYFYRLTAGNQQLVRKMLLLK